MKFQGRIYKVLPVTSGTSQKGTDWQKQEFIFEYFERDDDRYADKVLLSIMNDRIRDYDLKEGDSVIIGFSHTTREYQGRYFNDIRMYSFEKVEKAAVPAAPSAPVAEPHQEQPIAPSAKRDELPF